MNLEKNLKVVLRLADIPEVGLVRNLEAQVDPRLMAILELQIVPGPRDNLDPELGILKNLQVLRLTDILEPGPLPGSLEA